MRKFGAALSAGFMATVLLAGKAVPVRAHSPVGSQFQDVRLTSILGMAVEDPNADVLGQVKDLVLNVETGRIEYVIIGSQGFLGLGARRKAVPARAISPAIIRGALSASISRVAWGNAPAFPTAKAALAHPLGAPANPGSAPKARAHLQFTRGLLGRPVLDAQHQRLGKLTDLLVDLTGQKPPVVIVCSRRLLHPGLCFGVAVPLLEWTAPDRLVLRSDRRQLEQAPLFSEQAWQAAALHHTPVIYRVPGFTES